jgi:hypothetical protein
VIHATPEISVSKQKVTVLNCDAIIGTIRRFSSVCRFSWKYWRIARNPRVCARFAITRGPDSALCNASLTARAH